jgi:hypothetical protein
VDPVPDPLLLRKSGSAGNRSRTSVSVARNSDHKTIEAVYAGTQCFFWAVAPYRFLGNYQRFYILIGKRPLKRPRRMRVDNIEINLGDIGWGGVDWIGVAQDRNRWRALVNAVMNLRVP